MNFPMEETNRQDALFESAETPPIDAPQKGAPLAERCRPAALSEFAGQEDVLGADRPLRKAIENDRVPSMVLWGPPGSGKTTLARLVARLTRAQFLMLSATNSGAKDLRQVVERAQVHRSRSKTILFIDEIHRWNKSQQDALLPHVESGLITLIGATTENPSFEVNAALLSRTTVFTLVSLEPDQLLHVLENGLVVLKQDGLNIEAEDDALAAIASASHGDARVALNALEQAALYFAEDDQTVVLTVEGVSRVLQEKRMLYDKSGEEHYNIISAFHKSMRGSDPQAALYWFARMMESGEDPLYAARRMVRFASEDVGLADPNALLITIAARDAYHMLGSPEGELALAEAAVYLATAPKSNALYQAFNEALATVKSKGYLPAPMHIRNAPTSLMKDMGYGKGYRYDHDFDHAYAAQNYLPDQIAKQEFYEPTSRGFEAKIQERMNYWKELADKRDGESGKK
ncbi:MAG: replication-associated recombination protein A [Candidatus Hinthialibacter antarcticus]|nr:replication-associated recombination protein A [Candidatus Hinthialibacter antarcticus]